MKITLTVRPLKQIHPLSYFFLLFDVLSLVKHTIDYCGFQWVSVFSRLSPSLSGILSSKAYLLDAQPSAKIFKHPVSLFIFGKFFHNQLPVPDLDLRRLHKINTKNS